MTGQQVALSRLNVAQAAQRAKCEHWEDRTLSTVEAPEGDGSWTLNDNGTCWGFPNCGLTPKAGDTIRMYTTGGPWTMIVGQDLNGEPVYFKTEAERELEHAQASYDREQKRIEAYATGREKLDAMYEALPPVFKARIERFRRDDPAFRFDGESYELAIYADAVAVADALGDADRVLEWRELPYAEQQAMAPFSDGHSGASFAGVVGFAVAYLRGEL